MDPADALLEVKLVLGKCRKNVPKGYTISGDRGIDWLNRFCLDCWNLAYNVQNYLAANKTNTTAINDHVENVYLCFTQICLCVKYMERTIKAEETAYTTLLAARQHFIQRIEWCLNNLEATIGYIFEISKGKPCDVENYSYSFLIDLVMEIIEPYSSYKGRSSSFESEGSEENSNALSISNQIRQVINLILGYTLAFANVAMEEDKKALSALCQKVLRECIAFQNECSLCQIESIMHYSNRNLKGMSLEQAILQLEEYMNGALLRLTFKCFLDFEKHSIEKLRTEISVRDPNDSSLDELIADFDINLDRATQLGIFTAPFATNIKVKTIIRSCLASLESLDSCIIPSLQMKGMPKENSEILEEHYNEEVAKLKSIILDIVDSHALAACYLEYLSQCLSQISKEYNKLALQEIVQMGELLVEHFTVPINKKVLVGYSKSLKRLELFKKYKLILYECKAVLVCANQVDTQRILKRFQILRSVLRKFVDDLNNDLRSSGEETSLESISKTSSELGNSQRILQSIGIMPLTNSILYESSTRRRPANSLLNISYADLPTSLPCMPIVLAEEESQQQQPQQERQNVKAVCNKRRKDSLRMVMFKRQRSVNFLTKSSNSLQISDILNKLSVLSANMNASKRPKHIK